MVMLHKVLEKIVKAAVKEYLDQLSDVQFTRLVPKILGAQVLTEAQYKRLVDSATGDKFVEIYFADGTHATISNRELSNTRGPGW